MRAAVTALLIAACAVGVAAASSPAPYTAERTMVCLEEHHVLANRQPKSRALPPKIPAVSVVQMTFALIPPQALDHGLIVFEKDPETAQRVAEQWFRYDLAQAAKVKGFGRKTFNITLRDVFTVNGNSITTWGNQPVKSKSRRLIASCLR